MKLSSPCLKLIPCLVPLSSLSYCHQHQFLFTFLKSFLIKLFALNPTHQLRNKLSNLGEP